MYIIEEEFDASTCVMWARHKPLECTSAVLSGIDEVAYLFK